MSSPKETALFSYDIVLHFFDQLQSTHKGAIRGGRATLARCARVCRAWREPASYVLWRHLDSFHPLWNLLAGRNFSPESKWLSAFWEVSSDRMITPQPDADVSRDSILMPRIS